MTTGPQQTAQIIRRLAAGEALDRDELPTEVTTVLDAMAAGRMLLIFDGKYRLNTNEKE